MKKSTQLKILACICFSALLSCGLAQNATLFPSGEAAQGSFEHDRVGFRDNAASMECTDTVMYPFGKGSGSFPGIVIDPVNSADAYGQLFEAPQPITISGFDFFAYQNANNFDTVTVNCHIYNAGSNGFPTGLPLRSTTAKVGPGTSSNVLNTRITALFPSPVTVNDDYILVVEHTGAITIVGYGNNYNMQDGDGENLSLARISGLWYHGLNITVGSVTYDADFLLHPYVEYDLDVSFVADKHCIEDNDTVYFDLTYLPVYVHRMYNKEAFIPPGNNVFTWTFDDVSFPVGGYDTFAVYSNKGKKRITLNANLSGWKNDCIIVLRDSVDQAPKADFTYSGFNPVSFYNHSISESLTYYFADGSFTHEENPLHVFHNSGIQDVTLIVENACGADTLTKTLDIYGVGIRPTEGFDVHIFPIPARDNLTIQTSGPSNSEIAVQILDVNGESVWYRDALKAGNRAIDIANWPVGVYLVGTTNDQQFTTWTKLIIY